MWESLRLLLLPIVKAGDYFKQFFGNTFIWLMGLLLIILTPLNWLFSIILSLLVYLNDKIEQLTTILESIYTALINAYPPIAPTLAIANAIFPVSTLINVMTILFGMWILALAYRFVKSWLPIVKT